MHTIGIIGGGIGGITLAIALQQRGITAHVYEAAPELRPVGAGILVPPNAMQIYDRLGLAQAVAQAGMPLQIGEIRDVRAGCLQRTDMQQFTARFGFPTIAIHRGRLHQVLLDALDPALVQPAFSCVGITQQQDGVIVRFANGAERQAKAVVGADGLRSVVRSQIIPTSQLRYSGQSSYRAVVAYVLPADIHGTSWEVWAPGCRFGFAAISPQEVYWYATLDAPAGLLKGQTPVLPRLMALYAAFPQPIPQMLAATSEAAVINTDIHDLRRLPRWSLGRVGLLGDAAHATTPNLGQGGAQAVEDAAVLAECLATMRDPGAAFVRYEQRRRARATMVVDRSWQFGMLTHVRNPLLRAARNALIRSTPRMVVERQVASLFQV